MFEFGLGRDGYGTLKVFPRGDVLLTAGGRELTLRPTTGGLVLRENGTEVGRFSDGRKDTGTLVIEGRELAVTFPRRRRTTGALAEPDGTPVAELRVQRGVIVVEALCRLDPLAAALATTALLLHLAYERPAPEITPVWSPARTTLWGAAMATVWGGLSTRELEDHAWGGTAGDLGTGPAGETTAGGF